MPSFDNDGPANWNSSRPPGSVSARSHSSATDREKSIPDDEDFKKLRLERQYLENLQVASNEFLLKGGAGFSYDVKDRTVKWLTPSKIIYDWGDSGYGQYRTAGRVKDIWNQITQRVFVIDGILVS